MAEKEGFEPSRPFRGLHDFQSCALDQLGDFSIAVLVLISVYEASPNATALLLYQSFSQSQAPKTILSKKAESRGSPPCASAHFGNDAVHGMVHGDTQLVDTLTHLRFHGVLAVGRHHRKRRTDRLCRTTRSGRYTRPATVRRRYRPKIRYTFSSSVTPLRPERSIAAFPEKKRVRAICQKPADPL